MEKKNINRRDFIKIVGISTATVSGLFYGMKMSLQTLLRRFQWIR